MLGIWLYFLVTPFINVCTEDQKGKFFNIIYYLGYFAYTVFACYLPFHIKKGLNKFAATEEDERKALISGAQNNTEAHEIWKAYKSTFFIPSLFNVAAHVIPQGPLPITATLLSNSLYALKFLISILLSIP